MDAKPWLEGYARGQEQVAVPLDKHSRIQQQWSFARLFTGQVGYHDAEMCGFTAGRVGILGLALRGTQSFDDGVNALGTDEQDHAEDMQRDADDNREPDYDLALETEREGEYERAVRD